MAFSPLDLMRIQGFLDVPQFLLGDAAFTAGLSTTVLKAWLSRPPFVISLGEADTKPLGKGSARIFTLRRIVNIAVTAELVRLGITPKQAGAIGFHLTDQLGSVTEPFPTNQAKKPAGAGSIPQDVNIWVRNDVLIIGNHSADTFQVCIGDVLAFDIVQQLGQSTEGEESYACLMIDFSGLYQKTLGKLKDRMRLA
jgi:hypothetical protein